jgi:hypothetical protein
VVNPLKILKNKVIVAQQILLSDFRKEIFSRDKKQQQKFEKLTFDTVWEWLIIKSSSVD